MARRVFQRLGRPSPSSIAKCSQPGWRFLTGQRPSASRLDSTRSIASANPSSGAAPAAQVVETSEHVVVVHSTSGRRPARIRGQSAIRSPHQRNLRLLRRLRMMFVKNCPLAVNSFQTNSQPDGEIGFPTAGARIAAVNKRMTEGNVGTCCHA